MLSLSLSGLPAVKMSKASMFRGRLVSHGEDSRSGFAFICASQGMFCVFFLLATVMLPQGTAIRLRAKMVGKINASPLAVL